MTDAENKQTAEQQFDWDGNIIFYANIDTQLFDISYLFDELTPSKKEF
jgi:hypothetical protein